MGSMQVAPDPYTPETLAELVAAVDVAAAELEAAMELPDGPVEPYKAAEAKFKLLISAERSKVDAIGRFLKMLQYQAQICEMEIEALRQRHARLLKTYERVTEFVMFVMDEYGYKKIEGNLHRLTKVSGHVKVEIDPKAVGDIPLTYMRTIPARYEPDKTALKEALEKGETIPGASLVAGRPYLRVYT